MKKLYLLAIAILIGTSLHAQSYSREITAQQVISERLISLNGGMRAALEGTSRTTIPIRLPKGTVSWYYSFSTSPAGSGTQNLQLLMQLTAAAIDPSHLGSAALSELSIPPGSAAVDIYLLDQDNVTPFLQKADNNGGNFYYKRNGTVTATKQGIVPVSLVSGPLYLGIKNPSVLDGVDITIEVVALVSTEVYDDTWTSENAAIIYNNCLEKFIARSDEASQICDCFKTKLTADWTPSSYNGLSESEIDKIYKDGIAICTARTGNQSFQEKEKKATGLVELLRGQMVTKDYAAMETTLQELISLGYNSTENYNGLGFCQLCLKKYEAAKKALQLGLGKDPDDLLLLGNLADYYLLTGNYNQAIEIYKKYRNEKMDDNRRFKLAVSDDLKEFERLGITSPDFAKVRRELNID